MGCSQIDPQITQINADYIEPQNIQIDPQITQITADLVNGLTKLIRRLRRLTQITKTAQIVLQMMVVNCS